jgi:hypothetical protein
MADSRRYRPAHDIHELQVKGAEPMTDIANARSRLPGTSPRS